MAEYDATKDRAPLGRIGGVAIYATTILVAVHVVCMVLVALLSAAGMNADVLVFSRDAVLRGQAWRLLSYAPLNPPSLWFAIEMYLLFFFGRELEGYFGRRAFLRLYAGLILLPPLVLLALPGAFLAGSAAAHLALFVAVATLHPDTCFLWTIPAKWLAAVVVGLNALQALSYRSWSSLIALLAASLLAAVVVRHESGRPLFRLPRRKPALRVLPGAAAAPSDVDALLDKIGRSGIDSLTPDERARLEEARKHLLSR